MFMFKELDLAISMCLHVPDDITASLVKGS